jgi:hypothetical protein
MKWISVAGALLALSSQNAWAASGNSATVPGTAAATVVAPIVLTHVSGSALRFGTFTVGIGGTVVVSPSGAASTTQTVSLTPSSVNTADAFTVTGDPGRNFSITTTVSSVTSSAGSIVFITTPSASQTTLGAGGSTTFTVGGTLLVGSNILPGSYTGTYTATVTYD